MTGSSKHFELKGSYVVLCILALTAVVGSLFIYIGPKATEKRPGIIHVGMRYTNEGSIDFLRYGKKGPNAKIELIAADGSIAYTFEGLGLGRNLVPLEDIESGPYTARISAADYAPAEVPVIVEGRMLNPPKDAEFAPGSHADYNMIGVRLAPPAP
jgi:hypothetical protein